ncbi:MAG: acyl-CoA thioesterase [Desulfopila sp.]|jgi:acyl-CoA thioester hydrolase|nr:acyl-CoA thioesterase [Desulfopila sp.]
MKTDHSFEKQDHQPFHHEFVVTPDTIDQNGHVNNVVYIQWMQDVAVLHSQICGGTAAIEHIGCSWVVRSHKIVYLSPAYVGDRIKALTWVADFGKVRSLRKYIFLREKDEKVLARGETDWVFVKSDTGRPHAIPADVQKCFPLLPDYH